MHFAYYSNEMSYHFLPTLDLFLLWNKVPQTVVKWNEMFLSKNFRDRPRVGLLTWRRRLGRGRVQRLAPAPPAGRQWRSSSSSSSSDPPSSSPSWTSLSNKYQEERSENVVIKEVCWVYLLPCLLPWTSLSNRYQEERSEKVVVKEVCWVFLLPSAFRLGLLKH